MVTLDFDKLSPFYAFCDPHGGGTRELRHVASNAAIVVGAVDHVGRIFVFYCWADRIRTPALMDKILHVNERYKPKVFGVERNGLQGLFGDAIAKDAALRRIRLPLAKVDQPTNQEKPNRIRTTLQPLIAHGRLLLLPNMDELRHEIVTFPSNPIRDRIDALASMCRLIKMPTPSKEYDEEISAKLRYLRSSGAPPWYIEQVAKDMQSR